MLDQDSFNAAMDLFGRDSNIGKKILERARQEGLDTRESHP